MKASVSIVNVVIKVTLKHTLDLNSIVNTFPEVDYRPERFPGIVFKLRNPKTAHLIFGSGKMVCVGAKSEKLARRAVMRVVRSLKDNGIMITGKPTMEVVNIVASGSLGRQINLERAIYILDKTMYEPEQFPALIHRMDEPKVVVLIFTSGSLVITGAKREEDVYQAVVNIQRSLEKHDL